VPDAAIATGAVGIRTPGHGVGLLPVDRNPGFRR
jgi:hypothetical protein